METKNIDIFQFDSLAKEITTISAAIKQLEKKEKDLMEKIKGLADHSPYSTESFALKSNFEAWFDRVCKNS